MHIRKITAALVVVVLGLAAVVAHAQQSARGEVEKAVGALVAAYGEGPAGVDAYFSHYADDITIINGARGRWTKGEYHKLWKDVNAKGGGVAAASVKDLQIQMSPAGDAAATTFLMPISRRGDLQPGQEREATWIMAGTWFKGSDGKWLVKSLTFIIAAPAR